MKAWQAVVTVLVIIFLVATVQSILATPFVDFQNELDDSGDYSNEHFNGNAIIRGFISDWFNMGLVALFGTMVFGAAVILRRTITRERRR